MGCSWSTRIEADDSAFQYTVCASSIELLRSERVSMRSEDEILESSNSKNFTYDELRIATRNFRPNSVVGEGGFGSVYKGWLDELTFEPAKFGSGLAIAVKMLNHEGFQGHKEWLAEINYLGQLEHPNLVKLIGYCQEKENHLLVYEYMPEGSLDNHLFRRSSTLRTLSWNLRMRIALGTAKGLAFLHSSKIRVIYCDLKSSNILLDSDFNAKLSDFGLAKDGPLGEESYISTELMGTEGYAAPEYIATGHLTTRSDVYSFGVVLLEIMTGKRVIDSDRPLKEENLVSWAKPYLRRGEVLMIMDPRVHDQVSCGSAQILGHLVTRCLSTYPRARPKMHDIVSILEQLQDYNDMVELNSVKGETNCNPFEYQDDASLEPKQFKKLAIDNDFVIFRNLCEGVY